MSIRYTRAMSVLWMVETCIIHFLCVKYERPSYDPACMFVDHAGMYVPVIPEFDQHFRLANLRMAWMGTRSAAEESWKVLGVMNLLKKVGSDRIRAST